MKTQTQPIHTQGEWNVNLTKDSNPDLAIFCNGCQIATIEQLVNAEETTANVQRIVKAVNMHDKLVQKLNEALMIIQLTNDEPETNFTKEMKQLLKQAEQQ